MAPTIELVQWLPFLMRLLYFVETLCLIRSWRRAKQMNVKIKSLLDLLYLLHGLKDLIPIKNVLKLQPQCFNKEDVVKSKKGSPSLVCKKWVCLDRSS